MINRVVRFYYQGRQITYFLTYFWLFVFLKITQFREFNSSRQQDISDAFNKLLDSSRNFSYFEYDHRNIYLCNDCQQQSEGAWATDNKISLQVTMVSGTFNMQQRLDNFLYNPVEKWCDHPECPGTMSLQQFELLRPPIFLLVDLPFYEYIQDPTGGPGA